MREKDFSLCAWLPVLVISLPAVFSSSGWKPIAPPEEYYVTTPKITIRDCDGGCKHPFLDDVGGGQPAETQVKSTLLGPSVAFNPEKNFHQSNQKIDLTIFKPTEASPFFPSGEGKPLDSSLTYQEVFRQSPSGFFSYKTYGGPGKPAKTIYYGDLELAKPKFPSDVKYYKPFKQSLKTDVKGYKPLDNDVGYYQSPKQNPFTGHCSLYKVSFRQDLYYQYIQYKVHMPELMEFTLCLWMRFHNHSHDHSLFSYGAKHHRQAIYMWVSNLNEPALFNMKVLGQTIFRLNYPIKLYKWYHTCQSWNGMTGEWQVWVNSHRIGRGFHNLLVNHPIPGGGVVISGQEHRHFGKGFQEIPQFHAKGGLAGEITMLQMYKIALTAGKAYNDHSHHHSHYTSTTPEPPELPTEEPSTTTDHPLLENGQLKKHVNVLELAEALKKGQLDTPEHFHHSYHPQFFEVPLGHPYVSHVTPLAVHGNNINIVGLPGHAIFKRNDESTAKETQREEGETQTGDRRIKFINNVSDQVQVEKIKFLSKSGEEVDEDLVMTLSHQLAVLPSNITDNVSEEVATELYSEEDKSEDENSGVRVGKRLRRQNSPSSYRIVGGDRPRLRTIGDMRPSRYFTNGVKKRGNTGRSTPRQPNDGQEASKRLTLFDDSYLNFGSVGLTSSDSYPSFGGIPSTGLSYDHFPHFGQDFSGIGEQNVDGSQMNHEDSEKKTKNEVELAEGEVRRIMEICSGCQGDPFRKVAVISWRSTPKKMYSGTLFLKARSECENF